MGAQWETEVPAVQSSHSSDRETNSQPQATRRVEERRQITKQQQLETPEAEVREGLAEEVALDQA